MALMKYKNEKLNHSPMLLVSGTIGIITFILIYGVTVLDITNDSWLVNSTYDLSAHYIGWLYYRDSPWQFPIGLVDGIINEYSFSIIYMDSIPIFALVFKILSPLLPSTFQYFGLYGLITFALQSILACELIFELTTNSKASILGSIFFTLSTTLFERMFRHSALAFHPIILLAIMYYIKKDKLIYRKRDTIYWCLLLILSCSIHAYFIPMVFAFLVAFYLPEIFSKNWYKGCLKIVIPTLLTIGAMYIWGYFYGSHNISIGELGNYNSNINALFNDLGNSYIDSLMGQTTSDGIWEAYAYLGAGILIMAFIVIYDIIQKRKYFQLKKCHIPTIFIIIIFGIVSIFPIIRFGQYTLLNIPLPRQITYLLGTFRANGRFMWPIVYLIMLGITVYIINNFSKKAIYILFVCLLVQIFDLSRTYIDRHNWIGALMDTSPKLSDDVWEYLNKDIVFFFYEPVGGGPLETTYALGKYAHDHDMVMNDFYTSRKDSLKIYKDKITEKQKIFDGDADNEKLYIFDNIPLEYLIYETGLHFYEINNILIGIKNELDGYEEIAIDKGINLLNYSSIYLTDGKSGENGIHIYKNGIYEVSFPLSKGDYFIDILGDNLDNASFKLLLNGDKKPIHITAEQTSDEKRSFRITSENTYSDVRFICNNTGDGEILLTNVIITGSKGTEKPNAIKVNEIISFDKASYNADPFIKWGMSVAEDGFSWTEGNETEFNFLLKDAADTVQANIYVDGVFNEKQDVLIYVNGLQVYYGTLYGAEVIKFTFPNPHDNKINMKLILPNAIAPSKVGVYNDDRTLALMLRDITFIDIMELE